MFGDVCVGLSVPVTVRDVLAYFHLCGSLGGWWCGGLDVNIISGRGEVVSETK